TDASVSSEHGPADEMEPYSRVADDSRHVRGAVPATPPAESDPGRETRADNTSEAPPMRTMNSAAITLHGWGGAAPSVTSVGLAWPGTSVVSRESVPPQPTPTTGASDAAVNGREID